MRTHPVGEGLDQRRALTGAGVVERGPGHGVGREHVVAVDPHAGEAEALRALVERDPALRRRRRRDAPLVVLAEEHDRAVVDAGPHERLVDVALAAGPVAEVGDHGLAGLRVADRAVLGDPHRVAGGVQRLAADHDRVERELLLVRVPPAVAGAAEQAEQLDRVDLPAPRDAVLAVGREGEVLRPQRPARADLRRLLAEQRRPDAELALPLQRGGLDVDAADQDEVAVEVAVLLVGQVDVVVGVVQSLALRGEQLHERGACRGAGVSGLHRRHAGSPRAAARGWSAVRSSWHASQQRAGAALGKREGQRRRRGW